ncbi:uncharacterized protein LOC111047332 [Nilaparvata lugens]|uniref:uncharacterized protein LOC111047332 n=1 Tax=Nilaparvata lugens TaxID=108931 RepID=UPI00193EB355|nr:uncharacterized protein LOC111047332 [Nilaparvata lugens]
MDDLKLYARSPEQLQGMIELVSAFSQSICMKFGLSKCAVLHVEKGQMKMQRDELRALDSEISELKQGQSYKYLGLYQHLKISKTGVLTEVEGEFRSRLDRVLKGKLSAKNCIKAVNTWVIPALTYTFGILKWSDTRLEQIDRYVRTRMTKFRMHHPRASVARLYLPRSMGGRGLMRVSRLCVSHETKLRSYFQNADSDLFVKVCQLDNGYTALDLRNQRSSELLSAQDLKEEWRTKELHGRFYGHLNSEPISQELSCMWLTVGSLFPETEGFVQAIQDQVIATNAYRRHVMGDRTISDKCRMCASAVESIQHIVSGCSVLAPREYMLRHNNVAKIVHLEMQIKFGNIADVPPYYNYQPPPLVEFNHVKIYWDVQMITDRRVVHIKPDILVLDQLEKRAYIIDITVPSDENAQKTRGEKIRKYQELSFELKEMYGLNTVRVLPIVITVNGLILKSVVEICRSIDLVDEVLKRMQKSVLLDTARIVRKFIK